jgi:small subunit ribosomal protein S4e
MGKKGPTKHLKREMAPTFWPVPRKEKVWAIRTSPGPHGLRESTPLLVVVRDCLGYAETAKEAGMIIKQGMVLVDGKPRRDNGFSVGLMDVVELPDAEKRFRVLPGKGRRVMMHPIDEEEAGFKLCRIAGKTTVDDGVTQLNLHDGRNMLLTEGGERYSVNDTVKLEIPEQEIVEHVSFKPGVRAIITGGRSQGTYGILMGLGPEPGRKRTATIRTMGNEDVRTLAAYVFAVGSETSIISIPGGM